jgi:hypothetical protein
VQAFRPMYLIGAALMGEVEDVKKKLLYQNMESV